VAVCTSAISSDDVVSVVISHAAPTLWIHVPMSDATEANHNDRNGSYFSGSQAEARLGAATPLASVELLMVIPIRLGVISD
jgi:hypothetical protein